MNDAPPLATLGRVERTAVRIARRMQTGAWGRLCFLCQREIGARWIMALTGPLLEVQGLDHVLATSRDRPLLLVANHRSYFDLYLVMAVLFRRLPGWSAINFPVRGRFFYQTVGGMLVNALAAFWAMYPPFFNTPAKRRFDQWALNELADLCRSGPGQLVGFHPEGTRNRDSNPWNLLSPQPGVGRLILEATPQVLPVFLAGLGSARDILRRRFRRGEPIRIWFGPALEYGPFLAQRPVAATHRAVAEFAMAAIAQLAARDRERWGPARGEV